MDSSVLWNHINKFKIELASMEYFEVWMFDKYLMKIICNINNHNQTSMQHFLKVMVRVQIIYL